jgi:predicted secreted hydrolase
MRGLALGFVVTLVGLVAAVVWLRDAPDPGGEQALTVTSLLGEGDAAGFSRAVRPGGISLPLDHGPHGDYRSEWWYFTGNLTAAGGREFGFQLTFFRFALAPAARSGGAWATNQAYMAHFAITDVKGGEHRVVERLARGAAGLAGARAQPFRAWLDDWVAAAEGEDFLPLRLRAADSAAGIALDLQLAAGKPVVLQGEGGLSAKGDEPGNASWYYSYTRLPASGELTVEGERFPVRGLAWLDREWSTSSLDAGVVGWDWFALQLEDGRDLMLYALRREDGSMAAQSAGSLVGIDGRSRPLRRADFQLRPLRSWTSPATGVAWPTAWRVSLPGEALDLEVRAAVDDQEQNLTVRYWEGAVAAYPRGGGERLGRGYLEMTGYRPAPANSPR